MVVVICCFLWEHRNNVLFEGRCLNVFYIFNRSLQFIFEFNCSKVARPSSLPSLQLVPLIRKWQKPPPSSLKINSDAALSLDGRTSVGIAVRDHLGDIFGITSAEAMGSQRDFFCS